MAIETVRVVHIRTEHDIQIRMGLRQEVVERYRDLLDVLPAVTLVRLENGTLLMADGFHRLAAATAQGQTTLEAVIRDGTRADAMELSATINAVQGEPLTAEERDAVVIRLHSLHPDWSTKRIARESGVAESTATDALKVAAVKDTVKDVATPEGARARALTKQQYRSISIAPPELWPDLASAALERGWTFAQTHEQAHYARKHNCLDLDLHEVAPPSTPVAVQNVAPAPRPQPETPPAPLAVWTQALTALAKLHTCDPDDLAESIPDDELAMSTREITRHVRLLEELGARLAKRKEAAMVPRGSVAVG